MAPICALVGPVLITGFEQPLQIDDFITLYMLATLCTTVLLVYPLLTASTVY